MLIFFRILQLVILYLGGAYLCYAPFQHRLRLKTKRLAFTLALLFMTAIVGYVVFLVIGAENAMRSCFLLSFIACGAFYLWSIDESGYKSVVVLLLVICYGAFICGCAVFIANLMFPEKGLSYECLYTVAVLFIGGGTYLPAYRFMVERMIPTVNLVSSNDLQSVYFMPLFYIILQVVFFIFYDVMGQMSDLVYFVVLVSINVSTYFLVMDILNILNGTLDKLRMQEEISITEKLLDLQKSQYASWVTQIEAVRRARHDLKHHIAIIQTFLDKDDKQGLQEHIREFQRTLPESAPLILCKNMEVNAILLHYYERASKENIKLELLANVEESVSINSQDLAVVFGNCLENAFEACGRMAPEAEKRVSLMAKPMKKGLAIVIDNTFDGNVVKDNDVYLSSKRSMRAGVGMASVKLVVQKYGGIISFETENDLFMTSIRLGSRVVAAEGVNNE